MHQPAQRVRQHRDTSTAQRLQRPPNTYANNDTKILNVRRFGCHQLVDNLGTMTQRTLDAIQFLVPDGRQIQSIKVLHWIGVELEAARVSGKLTCQIAN
jgi:hypothetical protein